MGLGPLLVAELAVPNAHVAGRQPSSHQLRVRWGRAGARAQVVIVVVHGVEAAVVEARVGVRGAEGDDGQAAVTWSYAVLGLDHEDAGVGAEMSHGQKLGV